MDDFRQQITKINIENMVISLKGGRLIIAPTIK